MVDIFTTYQFINCHNQKKSQHGDIWLRILPSGVVKAGKEILISKQT